MQFIETIWFIYDNELRAHPVLFLFLLPALINFSIFLYGYFKIPKNISNDLFLAYLLLLASWQCCEGIMHLSPDAGTAEVWLRISHVPVFLIIPVWFVFILRFAGWNKKVSEAIIYILFIVPGFIFLLAGMARVDDYSFIHSEIFGWIPKPADTFITRTMYAWVGISALAMLFQLWYIYFRKKISGEPRNQVLFLAIGLTVPVIIGTYFEILSPFLFQQDMVPIASPLLTLFSVSIILAIRKHHFLNYSPDYHWGNIVAKMNDGILIVNNEDQIMYANKKFCDMVDYSIDELRGKVAGDLFMDSQEDKKSINKKVKDRRNNISDQYEILVRKKSGEKIWMLITGSPYYDQKGKIIGSIGIHSDITEQKNYEIAVKASEIKYQTLFDSSRDAVMLLNETGFFDCNPRTLQIFGCSTNEEFCSKNLADLSPLNQPCGTDSVTLANRWIIRALETGSASFEWMHKRADNGHEFPAEVLLSRMDLEKKMVLQATVRDITKRKEKEARFLESLNEISDYKYALNQSSIVSIADHRGIINFANDKLCETSKYRYEELMGKNHNIINSGYHSKEFFGEMWKTILSGNGWRSDVKNRAKDGTIFWCDTIIVPFKDRTGSIYQFVAIRNDITERKKAEEALIASETNLVAIFENTTTGFILTDPDLNIIKFNNRGSQLVQLAFGKELTIESCITTYLPEEKLSYFIEKFKAVLKGEMISYESSYILADDSLLWLEVNIKPVIGVLNELIGISFAINDITIRKQTEEKLLDTIHEIDTFIFRSSHDLKSPISSIKGLIQMLKKEAFDNKISGIIRYIEQANVRMENIVNDLASVVLIKDEKRERTEINLFNLVDSTVKLFEVTPGYEKIKMEILVDKELQIHSDQVLVTAIMQNLIGNAIKYRKRDEGHQVMVNSRKCGKYINISVADNGEGISTTPVEKIFEMFYRGNLKSSGTGLGLYIVKKAVTKLGGSIKVESKVYKGSTFTVKLPYS